MKTKPVTKSHFVETYIFSKMKFHHKNLFLTVLNNKKVKIIVISLISGLIHKHN